MTKIHLPLTEKGNARFILTASIVWALTFTACERKSTAVETALPVDLIAQPAEPVAKTKTFETARLATAIDRFEQAPTVENQSSTKLAFSDLNGEIAELEDRVVKTSGSDRADAASKLNNLQRYRDAELIRFAKAQAAEPVAKTPTFSTTNLGASIDKFEGSPTAENQSSVKLAFAEVNGEIAKREDDVVKTNGSDRAEAVSKLNDIKAYRDVEAYRFTKAQDAAALGVTPPADSRSGAQKVEDTAAKVGEKIEEGSRKVGNSIEKGIKNTGEAIKDATQ